MRKRKTRRSLTSKAWNEISRFYESLVFAFPGATLWMIGFGWLFLLFVIFAIQDFHPVVRAYPPDLFHLQTSSWEITVFGIVGLILVGLGFRRLDASRGTKAVDVGPGAAWVWLFALLIAASYLRLYHLAKPLTPFWDDWGNNLVSIRAILDEHKFYWMFPTDGREPFFSYFLVLIRILLPDLQGWEVLRIATWLVDLGALALLYLAGRELDCRRTGLVAVGLGALGMPMLQLTLTGMRAFTLSFDTSLLLWVTFRLWRKPTFSRFLQWGLALAFGVHTYTVFRCLTLGVPLLLLPWALAPKQERRLNPWGWAAALFSFLLLLGIFSGTLASTHPFFTGFSDFWESMTAMGWPMFGLAFFWATLLGVAARGARIKKRGIRLVGWAAAVGFTAILIFPLSRGFGFDDRLPDLSALRNGGVHGNFAVFLARKFWITFCSLFYYCQDRVDLQIYWTPFYDVFSQGLVVLGFVYLLAKPDGRKIFLFLMGWLGTCVYILSIDPSSTKLLCSAPPFFLLAGMAVSKVWEGVPRPSRKEGFSPISVLLACVLVLYGLWAGWCEREKLFKVWGARAFPDTSIADQIGVDEGDYRVYLAPSAWFFGDNTQFVLNRGRRYYILKEHNGVPENPGKESRDIVVLLDGAQVPGGNAPVSQALREQFKDAQWLKIPVEKRIPWDSVEPIYMWRVQIPAESLRLDPKGLLYRITDSDQYIRRYYDTDYGWGTGAILKEELVSGLDDPVPVDQLQFKTFSKYQYEPKLVEFQRAIQTGDGDTEWSFFWDGPIWLRIDGATVWRRDGKGNENEILKRFSLSGGSHKVEVRIRCGDNYRMPKVKWREVGDGTWGAL